MVDITTLNERDKIELLKELMYDEVTKPIIQAEFTVKINNVLDIFEKQLEQYYKEQDEENRRIHDNMWRTTEDSMMNRGVAKACAKIKRILEEIKMTDFDSCYDSVFRDIHNAKNKIMDNQLSNYARTHRAYQTILRYESQLADLLEHMWLYAFKLGMLCRARTLSEEEIKKLDDDETEMRHDLSVGNYDRGVFWGNVMKYLNASPGERNAMATVNMVNNMIPLNPKEHPEVMDFLNKL